MSDSWIAKPGVSLKGVCFKQNKLYYVENVTVNSRFYWWINRMSGRNLNITSQLSTWEHPEVWLIDPPALEKCKQNVPSRKALSEQLTGWQCGKRFFFMELMTSFLFTLFFAFEKNKCFPELQVYMLIYIDSNKLLLS